MIVDLRNVHDDELKLYYWRAMLAQARLKGTDPDVPLRCIDRLLDKRLELREQEAWRSAA